MTTAKPPLDRLRIDRDARPGRGVSGGVILWGALALLLLLGAALWWSRRPQPLAVQTVTAHLPITGSGEKTVLNASGYVTARRAATVSSKVTGKVTEILIEEGMKVMEGQILARLDATNVEASLHLAEAQLVASQTMLEETRPNLAFAQRERKRFAALAETKVVSDSDLRRSEMEALGLEARLARQTAEIAVREREVSQWRQQVDDTIIRAPFAGVVTSKNAQPGEMISPMSVGGFTRTGICTVVDMGSLEIEVDVGESYIHRVRAGLPVEATLDAYPTWHLPAKVIAIIPTADRQKATVKVRVGFDQLDPRILPDMGVKVAVQSQPGSEAAPARGVLTVPRAAVQQAGGQSIIWVVRGGRVERRAVSAAEAPGDEMAISAGLNDGERVVINAPRELADGLRVSESTR